MVRAGASSSSAWSLISVSLRRRNPGGCHLRLSPAKSPSRCDDRSGIFLNVFIRCQIGEPAILAGVL